MKLPGATIEKGDWLILNQPGGQERGLIWSAIPTYGKRRLADAEM